eukprot:2468359-Prymnesium_polylepis.1
MGAYGMDAAVSTLVPRRENGLNAPSFLAPSTADTVKTTMVSIKVKVDIDEAQLNEHDGTMQHHWFNGHRPNQFPWPAIECYNLTPSERIRFAFPNCSN